jgi:hypothetical protein
MTNDALSTMGSFFVRLRSGVGGGSIMLFSLTITVCLAITIG